MSYGDEVTALARDLARLATLRPNHVDEVGLEAALAGRTALLGLLVTIHTEATGVGATAAEMTLSDLLRHPVAALGLALHQHPRPRSNVSPTDLHQADQATAAGRLWVAIGLRATLAQREWQGEGERLSGETAWGAVADVAAMARTLAVLDDDLLDTAPVSQRPDVVEALSRRSVSSLRIAAQESLSLAQGGALPSAPVRRSSTSPLRVLPISHSGHLDPGQAQLARLLRYAGPLTPRDIELVTIAHVRICLHAAKVAEDGGSIRLAADLGRHAQLLGNAVGTAGRLASLHAGDPRPRLQAGELLRAHRQSDAMPPNLHTHAARLLVVTRELASATAREVSAGRWFAPMHGHHHLGVTWGSFDSLGHTPALVGALDAAAEDAIRRTSVWQAASGVNAGRGGATATGLLVSLPSGRFPVLRPTSPAASLEPVPHHAKR